MRQRQLFVSKSGAFVTEHQRHRTTRALLDGAHCCLAYIEDPKILVPLASGRGDHQTTPGKPLLEGVDDRRTLEHIDGPGGPRTRLAVGEGPRPNQHELR